MREIGRDSSIPPSAWVTATPVRAVRFAGAMGGMGPAAAAMSVAATDGAAMVAMVPSLAISRSLADVALRELAPGVGYKIGRAHV